MSHKAALREAMRPHWNRVKWNFRNLFTKKLSPYIARGAGPQTVKERTAFEDLFHSVKNLPVEYFRARRAAKDGVVK